MSITNKIFFTNEVIDSLIMEIVNKIPGIDKNKKIEINFNERKMKINVELSVKKDIINIFEVIKQIQNYIFFKMCKMLDIKHFNVDVFIKP